MKHTFAKSERGKHWAGGLGSPRVNGDGKLQGDRREPEKERSLTCKSERGKPGYHFLILYS